MSIGGIVNKRCDTFRSNAKLARNTWGDLNAQIGSLRVAERSLIRLLDRYGLDFIERAAEQLLDYSERWMRSEIAAIPDGSYEFSESMEDDGVVADPVTFHVTGMMKTKSGAT